ncbi:hypothetical protein NW762_014606 [Fusarium torreyae]|uniref:Organic hydroperoxide resistance protein n=1 Tax=Fusarium torreyae TaxID=1237075 RepID=A0A9W8RLQ7_9HYPO|nr:hypothetical protein NW762_014606 [Fusarium torreyae]
MPSIRSFQLLARMAARITPHNCVPTPIQRRSLNTESLPTLYSACVKVVGARKGHVEGENLTVDLTTAKALGGPGQRGKTNPEELFAAGYGACFQSAMNAVAANKGILMPTKPEDSAIKTTVHLFGDVTKLNMGLRVDMKVKVKGLEKWQLEDLVTETKKICPYSKAIKGNIQTNVEVVDFNEDRL